MDYINYLSETIEVTSYETTFVNHVLKICIFDSTDVICRIILAHRRDRPFCQNFAEKYSNS